MLAHRTCKCNAWSASPKAYLFQSQLNRMFGRRGTIFITAAFSFLTCIWQGVTNSWQHLFIARFFLGLGIGPKSSTVPVYAAECRFQANKVVMCLIIILNPRCTSSYSRRPRHDVVNPLLLSQRFNSKNYFQANVDCFWNHAWLCGRFSILQSSG